MRIIWLYGNPYIEASNGFQRITHTEAMEFYEKGEVSEEVDLTNEYID